MAWVLIADDDEQIREALQGVLHDADYAIVKVADGEDALEVLRATPYHAVVLLDLMMPHMSGSTVLEILKNDPGLARRHAWIVMSANHAALARIPPEVCAKLSLALLKKPFEMDDLLELVARQAALLPSDQT